MKIIFSDGFSRQFRKAPERVQKDFGKQLGFLLSNPKHPSLRAKKHSETEGDFQARVNDDWRFYFAVEDDTYHLLRIISHPK